MKKYLIIFGAIIFIILLALIFWISQTKVGTKIEKQLLKITGGEFKVYVYPAGSTQPVKVYEGRGYVWFEEAKNGNGHTGVVTFKTKDGKTVRVGTWGGVIIVEYE